MILGCIIKAVIAYAMLRWPWYKLNCSLHWEKLSCPDRLQRQLFAVNNSRQMLRKSIANIRLAIYLCRLLLLTAQLNKTRSWTTHIHCVTPHQITTRQFWENCNSPDLRMVFVTYLMEYTFVYTVHRPLPLFGLKADTHFTAPQV